MSLPDNHDWGFCVLRQFLYDAAETIRLAALSTGSLTPLAQLATHLRAQEKHHLTHGRSWVLRLGNATDVSRQRMQSALQTIYPHALGLFEPTEADESLAQFGICPHEEELRRQWESAVAPVLADAGVELPETVQPVYGGRVGRHHETLAELLESMRLTYNTNPSAEW